MALFENYERRIAQIEKTLNIYSSNISKCCSGKHKTYKKYIWKLESEVLKNE